MKLRVRSLESKQTLRVQVPDPCSLQRFKEIVSDAAAISSSIQLSLNSKDELRAASPEASLHSLGIRTGDLVFYSLNPRAFSPQSLETRASVPEAPAQDPQPSRDGLGSELDETLEFSGTDSLDVDPYPVVEKKGPSVPYFLRRVLFADEAVEAGNDYRLLVISIHAVLLDSGFVGFDPVSRTRTSDGFDLPLGGGASSVSLSYTLPGLLLPVSDPRTEAVVLKFQNLGDFVVVYGFLSSSNASALHQLLSDKRRFAPAIRSVWKNHNWSDGGSGMERRTCDVFSEREVFEFWKAVKDGLALPLMIDICETCGLALPPCLTRTPTELKLKILEFLPGIDIAKMGCVSSEFWYLSVDDELWKKKFVEEFGIHAAPPGVKTWRVLFARQWEARRRRTAAIAMTREAFSTRRWRFGSSYGGPVPFPAPNYDMQHGFCAPPHPPMRKLKLLPNCELGLDGHNA